jgi:hypothetical protein
MKDRENQIKKAQENRLENFETRKKYDKERYLSNPQKFIDNDRKVQQAKPEHYKNKNKKWRKENPERCCYLSSLHRNHDVNAKEEKAMLTVFDYSCAYCGMSLSEHRKIYGEKLHNEHVDDEGYNDLRNDIPACKACNCGKHQRSLEDWYPQQKFFSEERLQKIIWWTTKGYKDCIEKKPSYRFKRKRVYNADNTYFTQHELWKVDNKCNLVDIIYMGNSKQQLKNFIAINNII